MFANPLAVFPHLRNARLHALAITTRTRSPALPELPTMIEAGLPDYEVVAWYGVLAPAATPKSVIGLLNRNIVAIVERPETQERLSKEGAYPVATTPEQLAEFMKSETIKWARVIKAAGARVD